MPALGGQRRRSGEWRRVYLYFGGAGPIEFRCIAGTDQVSEELRLRDVCGLQPWPSLTFFDRGTGAQLPCIGYDEVRSGQEIDVASNQDRLQVVRDAFVTVDPTHEGRATVKDLLAELRRDARVESMAAGVGSGPQTRWGDRLVAALQREPSHFVSWVELESICEEAMEPATASVRLVALRFGDKQFTLPIGPDHDPLDALASVRAHFGISGAFSVLDGDGQAVRLSHTGVRTGEDYHVVLRSSNPPSPACSVGRRRQQGKPGSDVQLPRTRPQTPSPSWSMWMGPSAIEGGDGSLHDSPADGFELVDRHRYSELRRLKGWIELRDDAAGLSVPAIPCDEVTFSDPRGPCQIRIGLAAAPCALLYGTDFDDVERQFSRLRVLSQHGVSQLLMCDIGKVAELPSPTCSEDTAHVLGCLRYLCDSSGVAHDIPPLLSPPVPPVVYLQTSTGLATSDVRRTPFSRRARPPPRSAREDKMREWQQLLEGGGEASLRSESCGSEAPDAVVAAASLSRLQRSCELGRLGVICYVTGAIIPQQSAERAAERECSLRAALVDAGIPSDDIVFEQPAMDPPSCDDPSDGAVRRRAAYTATASACYARMQQRVVAAAMRAGGRSGEALSAAVSALEAASRAD
eukprot:TRINITY_DN685_c12_g1_i1.p1 TRINITY_DN685_c12_g1~~TRINITY_DN685_c12_g1_i1.p1  ORF type:complete len:632 (+),score=167.64 TRINITY_DN685_c12_g1_i1:52-1947(+)